MLKGILNYKLGGNVFESKISLQEIGRGYKLQLQAINAGYECVWNAKSFVYDNKRYLVKMLDYLNDYKRLLHNHMLLKMLKDSDVLLFDKIRQIINTEVCSDTSLFEILPTNFSDSVLNDFKNLYGNYVKLLISYKKLQNTLSEYKSNANYSSWDVLSPETIITREIKLTNDTYLTDIDNNEFVECLISSLIYAKRQGTKVSSSKDGYTNYAVQDKQGGSIGVFTLLYGSLCNVQFESPKLKLNLSEYSDECDTESAMYISSNTHSGSCKLDDFSLGFQPVYSKISSMQVSSFDEDFYSQIDDVNAAYPDKNFAWIKDQKYEIVSDKTLPYVLSKIRWCIKHHVKMAIDTETTGKLITVLSRTQQTDVCVGFSISMKEGESYYFPLQMRSIPNLYNGDHFTFMQTVMKPLLETGDWIVHNAAFDWKVFYIYGINLHYVADTMMLIGVTYRYQYGPSILGLKTLCKKLFGLDMYALNYFSRSGKWGKGSGTDDEDAGCFADLPYEFVRLYATTDADVTLRLYNRCISHGLLEKYHANKAYDIELKFARAGAYSSFHGLHVDEKNLPVLVHDIETTRNELISKLKAEAKKLGDLKFDNPNSPPQLSHIFYDILGLDPAKNQGKAKNKRSTDKTVIKHYADMMDANDNLIYPFIALLQTYREYDNIYTHFTKKKDSIIKEGGLLFSDLFPLGTETGRVSVKEPNYQSFNDAVKKYMTPRKGFKCFDCDYSQVELRILFSMAQQYNLMESANDPDTDLHIVKAMTIYQVPYAMVTKKMRKISKKFNFGVPYGMSLYTMAEDLGISLDVAKVLYKAFFSDMPKVEDFFERVRSEGVLNKFTSTLFGRRRYYSAKLDESSLRRQAGNHVIQGTAADIWKMAVIAIMDMIERNNWWDLVLLDAFIHDEVFGEISEEINYYDFVKEWRQAFEIDVPNFCKLYAGFGVGDSWYEAKHMDLPPLFIEEIINNPKRNSWNYDGDQFVKDVYVDFEQHKKNRVRDHILNVSNQNEIIKPIIFEYMKDVVNLSSISDEQKDLLGITKDITYYENYLINYVHKNNMLDYVLSELMNYLRLSYTTTHKAKELTAMLYKFCKEHNYSLEFSRGLNLCSVQIDLQDYLKLFCNENSCSYESVSILSADDVAAKESDADTPKLLSASEIDTQLKIDATAEKQLDILRAMQLGFSYKSDLKTGLKVYVNYDMFMHNTQISNLLLSQAEYSETALGGKIQLIMVHDFVDGENEEYLYGTKKISDFYQSVEKVSADGKEYIACETSLYLPADALTLMLYINNSTVNK